MTPDGAEPDPGDPGAALSQALDDLGDSLAGPHPVEPVLEGADEARARLEDVLRGRRLTPDSLVLARARRVRAALDQVEEAANAGDEAGAREHLEEARRAAEQVAEDARGLPEADPGPGWSLPGPLRNAGTVARKEAIVALQGTRGLVLLALFLATFGLGLESAVGADVAGVEASVTLVWTYAHSVDFLAAPLAGILLGHGLVNGERRSGTIHFLGAMPIPRSAVAIGKWVGAAAALAATVATSALAVGLVAYGLTGNLGDPGVVVGYVASVYLLALAFASLALAVSALVDRPAGSLGGSLAVYVVLGLVWQNAFLVRRLENLGASGPSTSSILLYLASPFTAWWNWTSELLGPTSEVLQLPVGEPWHASLVEAVERGTLESLPFYAHQWWYVLVMVAWCLAGLAAAAAALHVRDLA